MGEHFDPWPSDHPLAHKSIDESLARVRALKRDDVVAFHRDFYGTANGEIVVVGDFDPAAVRAQLETLFAGWTAPKPYAPIRTRHNAVAAEVEMIETPDKANAVVVARTNLALSDADPDYPALVVANHVLGSGALASRLGDRLRQKDGLTYGVSSALNADASPDGRDDAGSLAIQAIAAPQNVPRLVAGMNEEVQRWARDGITATELSDAVANLLTQRSQSRAADANVSAMLARNLYLGRTMAWTAEFEARLKALTVDEVNAAIRRHVKPETISVYAAGDFATAAGTAATGAK
ncbi:MAG: insulinase family protein, partial [Pseudomonas sp.]|nr:insulinase family protein [Pseudomonas sp.]